MATLARQKHAPHERQIAKALGLSDAQLAGLLRIRSGYWPGNAATVLVRKGYAYEETETVIDPRWTEHGLEFWRDKMITRFTGKRGLTEAGEAVLRRARAMGY